MEKPLQGKLALITGGSRGIGRATAFHLAELGCNLIINYLKNQVAAEEVVENIRSMGNDALAIKADIGDHEQIKSMFSEIKKNYGKLDILINNAAFGALGPAMRIGRLTWNMTMNLNTGGLLLCTQQAVKLMRDGGRIINLSSLGSKFVIPDYLPIGTTKAAIEAMTRYLAVELYEKGIIVNAVSAGFIDTEALNVFKNVEHLKSESIKKTPAGKIGTADDIAKIIAFLCRDESAWIVGQTIIADGGASISFC